MVTGFIDGTAGNMAFMGHIQDIPPAFWWYAPASEHRSPQSSGSAATCIPRRWRPSQSLSLLHPKLYNDQRLSFPERKDACTQGTSCLPTLTEISSRHSHYPTESLASKRWYFSEMLWHWRKQTESTTMPFETHKKSCKSEVFMAISLGWPGTCLQFLILNSGLYKLLLFSWVAGFCKGSKWPSLTFVSLII